LVRLPPAADSATKSPPLSPPLTSIIIPPPEEIVNTNGISIQDAPIAISGNNTYVAWPNNDTGHWNVFFAKSIDNGKTITKIIRLSSPNIGSTIDENTQIAANGKNVYVTWWTNKTGVLKPVFRASNDNGGTFGRIITLNSTTNSQIFK